MFYTSGSTCYLVNNSSSYDCLISQIKGNNVYLYSGTREILHFIISQNTISNGNNNLSSFYNYNGFSANCFDVQLI